MQTQAGFFPDLELANGCGAPGLLGKNRFRFQATRLKTVIKRYPRAAWHAESAVFTEQQLSPVPDAIHFITGFAFGPSVPGRMSEKLVGLPPTPLGPCE